MNCIDFREILVAHAEGALPGATEEQIKQHLAACPECRREQQAVESLQRQLNARAGNAAGVALTTAVMARIREQKTESLGLAGAPNRLVRWLVGLGTAAAAVIILSLVAIGPGTKAQAAVDVMNRGIAAAARLTSVYLKAQMRTLPGDNFAQLKADADFSPIELWKEFDGQKRWRVEKPGRVAVMDGASTLLFLRGTKTALRLPKPVEAAFDSGWLHTVADIEQTLSQALKMAESKGWKMELRKETDVSGTVHALVTIDAFTGLPPEDHLTNKFISVSNTRRVYRFNDTTGQLEALQMFLRDGGDFRLVLEVTEIAYNAPMADNVFQVELPADVAWYREPQPIANNDAYAAMTPQQAARAFFEACGRQDWDEAQKFLPMPLTDPMKNALGGLVLVNLGETFTSAGTPSQFVPYEIQFPSGKVKKHNLALRKHPRVGRWMVDGGL